MLRLAPSRRRIVIIIYTIAAAFCAMALIVATSHNVSLGLLLIGLEIFVILGIRQLGLKADVLKMSLEKRASIRKLIVSKGNSKQNVTQIKKVG
jgi:hypothetical protein